MSALAELAARVEAIDGRNNGGDMTLLTSEIARALGWVRVSPSEARNKSGHWVAPEDCRDGKPVYDSLHGTDIHRAPPPWLWSIDAALTLVPEGLEWELYAYHAARDPRFGRFQTRIPLLTYGEDPEELGPQAIANGHTAALALTAASLRARAAEGAA